MANPGWQLRIGYVCNGSPLQEMGQIGGFPPGYWPRPDEIWYSWEKKSWHFCGWRGRGWFIMVLGRVDWETWWRTWVETAIAIKRWLEWIFSTMSCRMLDSSDSLPGNGRGDKYRTESRHTMSPCTCLELIDMDLFEIRGLKTRDSC